MKPSLLNTLSFCVLSALAGSTLAAPSHFEHFITRDGAALMDGKQTFRFAGIHAPELHRIEDDARGVCKADLRGWGQYFKWPTAEEQANWIRAMVQSGAKAQRVYVLSVQQENDQACERETHILAPATADGMPVLNEKAMVVYDNMIAEADKQGLRLILPFIDHWWWWGGREQLAAFYKETADDFYRTSSKTYKAYQDIIRQVITRKNTITGRHYYDEKAIMAWETGNELEHTTEAFLTQTAAWIKRFAPHQLVIDGTYKKINDFSLRDPNVDIISNHYYTNAGNNHPDQVKKDLSAIAGKKVYLVGEFGLLDHKELNNIMQSIVHTEVDGAKAAGGFIWGFRGHRHDGGFYWHKEHTGHYSYHLPGFPVEGKDNQEMEVVDLVRQASAQMAGLKQAPALPVPDAPLLRNTDSPFAINWMGSPVGRAYDIERATSAEGPWTQVGKDVSDGINELDPSKMSLFSDDYSTLKLGQTYYYRVSAKNESGVSRPSNVIVVKHIQQNLAPVVDAGKDLATTVDQGVLLSASWRDDKLPTPQVKVGWRSTRALEARFCHADQAETRAWFPLVGEYELTFSADDGLEQSAKAIKVHVGDAKGELPASYCAFSSAELTAKEGLLNVVKSTENQLEVAADGFAGPFASEGDKISWNVEAPWSGTFNLHLHFNGKWGAKKNSVVINGTDIHPIEFPQTDEAGQVQVIPVQLKQGKNEISFGKFAGDWGYMFVKSVKVVVE